MIIPVVILLLRVAGQLSDRQLRQGGVTQAGGRGAHCGEEGRVSQLLGDAGEVVVQVGEVTVTGQQVTCNEYQARIRWFLLKYRFTRIKAA